MIVLKEDQALQVAGVRQAMIEGHGSVLMQAATGAGKTVMAAYIVRSAGDKSRRTWFVVPRRELLRQTCQTYDRFGIGYGVIAAGYPQSTAAVNQVASLQSVVRRLGFLTPPDLMIIDEAHYGGGDMDRLISWARGKCRILGLSATPVKHNGSGMDRWYDAIVPGAPIRGLIASGRLSGFRLFAPYVPDLGAVKVTGGEFNKRSMQQYMDDHGKVLIANCVDTYKKEAAGLLGLTYASSIKESKRIAEAYCDAGIPAAHMDGTMADDTRKAIIAKYADRHIMQIVSVDIMTFGFDLAAQVGRDICVECMSDAAPTKSLAKQLQKWGRVLRAKPQPALIFDHAANVFQHGMPDDEREWALAGRKKRRRASSEREVPMRQCSECFFCHSPAPSCPNCGLVYPIQGRVIKEEEGALAEIKAIAAKKKRSEVGMAISLDALLKIERERGYKRGWAMIMAKKKGLL